MTLRYVVLCVCSVFRVRLISQLGKQDSRTRQAERQQQDATATAAMAGITDSSARSWVEEKLHELDAKNDTIHVRLHSLASLIVVMKNVS